MTARVVQAAICSHPAGQELRVSIEPEEKNELLHSELACFDFSPLEEMADDLRGVLLEKGWTEVAQD